MAIERLAVALEQLQKLVRAQPSTTISDADLLERFIRIRDQAAFEVLLWRHGPMVLGLCHRLLRDSHAAEDAFQATFLLPRKQRPSASANLSGAGSTRWLTA